MEQVYNRTLSNRLRFTGCGQDVVLEPWNYHEDFESRTLGAWASYPLWQDTAYDPNFRVDRIVADDPNLSVVQKVTPYTPVDNYAGAQKRFDLFLVPGSEIKLRYFLKTNQPVEFVKIRLAAGPDGTLDYTIPQTPLNRWEWLSVTFDDIVRHNPLLTGHERIKLNALALLAKLPKADPAMPFYLGLDDVTIRARRPMEFQFIEPAMHRLSEWKPFIPDRPYGQGDTFTLSGRWPLEADRVELSLAGFADPETVLQSIDMQHDTQDRWYVEPFRLTLEPGLYLNTLRAYNADRVLAETRFTLHIAPADLAGRHPRLWFDARQQEEIAARLRSDKGQKVHRDIAARAEAERDKLPVDNLVYDLDQYPDEDWLATWAEWGTHLYPSGEAVYWNALAYTFHDDRTAGEYAKDLLVKLAGFKDWTHPWLTKRGMFSEHRKGSWSHRIALAYDLTYDLMTADESRCIRAAILKHAVQGAHITYVRDDNVTSNTSNWVAHIAGGSLMLQAAIFADGPESECLEPNFTGAAMKLYDMLLRTGDADGAWGEGLGYHNYTMRTVSQSLPALDNVFNIDLAAPLHGLYREYLWAGPIAAKRYFFFGDTGGNLIPAHPWVWLLHKTGDPLLGWMYNYLLHGDEQTSTAAALQQVRATTTSYQDFYEALYPIEDAPLQDPFDQEPTRLFRGVGTTVFKSGWKPADFIFVMRTGPFYNHQHLDQGSFWVSFNRNVFIEERQGSTYYDDPLYQPWYTQPVGHSTILIDGNHQSQRVGDLPGFAPGFEDHAQVTHFLDGTAAAFVSGDIGRLYWGKVESLQRNVLYLKPDTVLMLDTVVPAGVDADVTLLYQTPRLENIVANPDRSTITRDGNILHIEHLYPQPVSVAAVETPHYLNTLRKQRPLIRAGMLTVTARTTGTPLVMANLLTGTAGEVPQYTIRPGDGYVTGTVGGTPFAFATTPGRKYSVDGLETDALALAGGGSTVFAALCTTLSRDDGLGLTASEPLTCQIAVDDIRYYHQRASEVRIRVPRPPEAITVNGHRTDAFAYDEQSRSIRLILPAGEGRIRL